MCAWTCFMRLHRRASRQGSISSGRCFCFCLSRLRSSGSHFHMWSAPGRSWNGPVRRAACRWCFCSRRSFLFLPCSSRCKVLRRRRERLRSFVGTLVPLPELIAILMVVAVCALLLAGYPVALTLGGVSLAFAAFGHALGAMDIGLLYALPQRIFGVMSNGVLLAIPLFIFMGVMLDRSRIAEDLLETMGRLFGSLPGGLGISVVLVGALLAAAKGVVGATVVTIALITLPTMLRHGYDKRIAAGTVAATATLAQILPPATVLVLLGDQLNNSFQAAQLAKGIFAPESVSVSDLFAGALVPGLTLVAFYILFLVAVAIVRPAAVPAIRDREPDEGVLVH